MSMRLVLLLITIAACKDVDSPKTSAGGEECAIGARTTHPCATGLTCKESSYTPPTFAPGEVHTPDKPSGVGGNCGGVAGFHCADGLACDMTPEQASASDGMGSCARMSTCQ